MMKILAGAVGIVGIYFLGSAVVGLLIPSWFRSRKTGEVPARINLFVGYLAGSLALFALAGWLNPNSFTNLFKQQSAELGDKQKTARGADGNPAPVAGTAVPHELGSIHPVQQPRLASVPQE